MNSRQDYIMDTRLNAAILHRYGSSINNFQDGDDWPQHWSRSVESENICVNLRPLVCAFLPGLYARTMSGLLSVRNPKNRCLYFTFFYDIQVFFSFYLCWLSLRMADTFFSIKHYFCFVIMTFFFLSLLTFSCIFNTIAFFFSFNIFIQPYFSGLLFC